MNYLVGGINPQRQGTAHPNIVPYQTFATADSHLSLAVGTDRQFAACMHCLGLGDLAARREIFVITRPGSTHRDDACIFNDGCGIQQAGHGGMVAEVRLTAAFLSGPINTIQEVFSEPYAIGARTGQTRQPRRMQTGFPPSRTRLGSLRHRSAIDMHHPG